MTLHKISKYFQGITIIGICMLTTGVVSGCTKEEPSAAVIPELKKLGEDPRDINIANDKNYIYFSSGDPNYENAIIVTLDIDTSEVSTKFIKGVQKCCVLPQQNLVLAVEQDGSLSSRPLDHPNQVTARIPVDIESFFSRYFGPSESKRFAVLEARHIKLDDGTDNQLIVLNPKTLSILATAKFDSRYYDFYQASNGKQYEKPPFVKKNTLIYSIVDEGKNGVSIESSIMSKCEECSGLIGRDSSGSWVFRDYMPITRKFFIGNRKIDLPRDFWESNGRAIYDNKFIYDDNKGITIVDLDSGKDWRFYVKHKNDLSHIGMFFIDGFEGIGILSQPQLYFLDLSGPEPRFVSLKDLFQ